MQPEDLLPLFIRACFHFAWCAINVSSIKLNSWRTVKQSVPVTVSWFLLPYLRTCSGFMAFTFIYRSDFKQRSSQQVGSCGLYLVGTRVECRPGHRLCWIEDMRGFPQSFQVNSRRVPKEDTTTPLPVHALSSSRSLNKIQGANFYCSERVVGGSIGGWINGPLDEWIGR
jgi:hypothetical protein